MTRNLLLVLMSIVPGFAAAQDFNYNYIDLALIDAEVDVGPFNLDGDGFAVAGSFSIADNMFVIAGYSDQDYDFGIDGNTLNLGVGFHTDFGDNLDFVADISFLDAEVATRFGSADENGYGIRAGVRGRINPELELEGGLTLIDLNDSDTGIRAAVRYYFSDAFAVSGTIADNDGGLNLAVGIRAEFGGR
jgi:hypothetical protein